MDKNYYEGVVSFANFDNLNCGFVLVEKEMVKFSEGEVNY